MATDTTGECLTTLLVAQAYWINVEGTARNLGAVAATITDFWVKVVTE